MPRPRLKVLFWGLGLGVFFLSTLALSWPPGRQLFVSPDENSAFTFAQELRGQGSLTHFESANDNLHGLIHPRSALGYGQGIVPGSFIGLVLILAGVGKVFGTLAMYLVTPILALLTLLAWQYIVNHLFYDTRVGNLATLLLMIHPAFWYYSGRVMMHNVAFLSFLVFGVWIVLAKPLEAHFKKSASAWRLVDWSLAGLSVGLALIIRTSEALWVIPGVLILMFVYRASLGWRAMTAFGTGLGVALIVLGAINASVYGSPFKNGYNAEYAYAEPATSIEGTPQTAQTNWLLPFGFHERVILHNVWSYGFKLYPWMSILALAGMVLSQTEKSPDKKTWRLWLGLTLGLAVFMAIYYGSWKIVDNPDPSIISLGNSQVRYWLPLFALSSVFGAKALSYMLPRPEEQPAQGKTRVPFPNILRRTYVGLLIVVCTLLSAHLVFYGDDGFVPTRQALASFAEKREFVTHFTEEDAIIIVDRADKYLWPERRVVVPLRSEATYQALPDMLKVAPVYYFGISLPPEDLDYLNSVILPPLGVTIVYSIVTVGNESLYQFFPIESSE